MVDLSKHGFSMSSGGDGFNAAFAGPNRHKSSDTPGLQGIYALCEVTGGGQKVFGIAIAYDETIDPSSLTLDTYEASVYPAVKGPGPGRPRGPGISSTTNEPRHEEIIKIYTNNEPALLTGKSSVPGQYVIVEFKIEEDLSLPTRDSDKVSLIQVKDVKTNKGTVYTSSETEWNNVGQRGRNMIIIRGVDEWEQNHWWWDDERSTFLEYSIYLPRSFLKPGGDQKSYPLLLTITHSGTTYDGTCAQTLCETGIASIWSLPEEQDRNECIIITPRYERTTFNDYWEHTSDVENTFKLVESLLKNKWNFGNPNLEDRAEKILKVDPSRVYCTGWSMGAMTSLWLMSRHPETFAAGLIIAGQQRPNDVIPLAKQKLLIVTGTKDDKATPWNEKCVPVWEKAGGKVTRPEERLDPKLIFPIDKQQKLTNQIEGYLGQGGNITYLTFQGVDHMESARKFFYIQAAKDWLFKQSKD